MASYIALDIGEKRIGVALADVAAPFPAPLVTLEASDGLVDEFAELFKKHRVETVVIGLPRNQSGERTAQTERVEYIANLLNIPSEINVVWQDESLTSVKAETELKKRKKNFTKGEVDSLAATYILEDFLQSNPSKAADSTELVPAQEIADESTKTVKKPKKPAKKQKKPLSRKKFASGIAGLVVLVVVGVSALYVHALTPRTKDDHYSVISVKSGSGTQQIAQDLQQHQLIRSATAFTLYVRLNRVSNLQAGDYRLSSKQSVQSIVKTLSGGNVTNVNILIAPGLRLDQIVTKLQAVGYSQQEIDEALVKVHDHPLLKDLPSDTKLEGYLFPDTYQIGPDTSAEQLLRLMLDNFQKKVTPEISSGLSQQGLTLNQGVILASIVQKEVSDPETQRTVAQVFLTRLNSGTMLGSDVTFIYAATVEGGVASPELNSPYNTRKYTGLPPTAISNFNLSALKAVANPSPTDYLFFVAGDDGNTYFSHTLEEHQAYINKYCKKLCS